jgi:tRNA(adenine34) deaminase
MDMEKADVFFMQLALDHAREALVAGEFPVGCVITDGRQALAAGRRRRSSGNMANETDHAEMVALGRLPCAGRSLTLYSTLEPCLMCVGAAVLSGVNRIVYAYEDVMGGACDCDLRRLSPLYRRMRVQICAHVRRPDSLALFKSFFGNPDNCYWSDSMLARYTLAQP